ncbi:DUF1062 domain-containing protein [Actinospica robiniae]|uniref:DUF1062 domain-containing protein n=1 Tax=Actinospica robiniae TaxID=304901 RepID=UPI00041F9D71|nr:DUF1062 domain-containing protein [Actinospica robiniae]
MNQDLGRKSLWTVRQLGLPAVVRSCPDCRCTRHQAAGKFRVNANGKLLDVWMLVLCEGCGRTSKVPVHERIHVRELDGARRTAFENNDGDLVHELVTSASLAERAGYRLDWEGTWALETDMPFIELEQGALADTEVIVGFELPVPIRVERLLMEGLGLSRGRVRALIEEGLIRLPGRLRASGRVSAGFGFAVGGGSAPFMPGFMRETR